MTVFHDFETYSEVDILKVGGEAYARHPSTEVLMLAWAVDDEAPQIWVPAEGEPMPLALRDILWGTSGALSAFNAPFEMAITRHVLKLTVDPNRYRCSMAEAYTLGFSGTLGDVTEQIGLPADKVKDKRGKQLINRFCKPAASNHKADRYTKETHPEEWEEFKQYCLQDVVAERAVHRYCETYQSMTTWEQYIWQLDHQINQRGLPVDTGMAKTALDLHEIEKKRLRMQMIGLTGLDNPNSRDQLMPWLAARGCEVPNLQAGTIDNAIENPLGVQYAPGVTEVLKLKRLIGMTAPTKWRAYLTKSCRDDKLRGMFQFAGASRTRRWASRGINLQNLKRPPKGDYTALVRAIKQRDVSALGTGDNQIIPNLAGMVRAGIKAQPGHRLVVADLSSIESRVVGALAGCKLINDTFAAGLDTYKVMATRIFNTQYDQVNKDQRTFSKPVVLAGPYGQGKVGLVKYGADMGVALTEDEAKQHVDTFRASCWEIPEMWRWLEVAIFTAIREGHEHVGYGMVINIKGDFLVITLPTGRGLYYHQPRVELKRAPWGQMKDTFTYMGVNQDTTKWCRIKAHMGSITENIVQAIARDILAWGLHQCALAQLPVVGHVHDEIILHTPWIESSDAYDKLVECMTTRLPWMPGLLLDADGYIAEHYRKD